MKTLIFIIFMSFSVPVYADCEAPDLVLEKHNEIVHGYKIEKVLTHIDRKRIKPESIFLKNGGHEYSLTPVTLVTPPVKLDIEISEIKRFLKNNLIKSIHNYELGQQKQNPYSIEVYDLSGNSKADLIFFLISPFGVNEYSGAIVLVDGQWKTKEDPGCF